MKRTRFAIVAAIAAAAAVTYAVEAPVMVTICHRPPGHELSARTLSVPVSAVPGHLAHDDRLGACPVSGSR
jgi:hypothetical protein